jgi:hypothetical protein
MPKCGSMAKVRGRSSAITIVEVRPGNIPRDIPITTPIKMVKIVIGLKAMVKVSSTISSLLHQKSMPRGNRTDKNMVNTAKITPVVQAAMTSGNIQPFTLKNFIKLNR